MSYFLHRLESLTSIYETEILSPVTLKKMCYHLPKVMMRLFSLKVNHLLTINWTLKMPVAKEILKYLDKFEWKPEYLKISKDVHQNLKISKDVHQRFLLVLQYVTACSRCLIAPMESGNPPQCSWFCKDCMKYKRVCSEH